MASPKTSSAKTSSKGRRNPASRSAGPRRPSPLDRQLPLVSGRWLLWSLAAVFGGGLLLVYLTLVLLFWQGHWQILFHPTRSTGPAPTTIGLPLQDVAFDVTATGQPRLDGWFIPAVPDARYAHETVLYLHSMTTGSLADAAPELTALHQLGINIFAFDYRGFGKSEFLHPSEATAAEDVDAAWQYLTETRHIAANSIVVYGNGLAGSLAADLAARHFDEAGLVMDGPTPKALDLLRADPRSQWMPVAWLAHDVFDPSATLARLKLLKLFLLVAPEASVKRYVDGSADPKLVVYLPETHDSSARQEALRRFFDELPATPPTFQ